jgi:hypothetical protein
MNWEREEHRRETVQLLHDSPISILSLSFENIQSGPLTYKSWNNIERKTYDREVLQTFASHTRPDRSNARRGLTP